MAIVRGQDVIESYQQVLPSAAKLSKEYLDGIESSIKAQNLPVRLNWEAASTGVLNAAMGISTGVFVVRPKSRPLEAFRMLLYAVPSGSNLAAGWFLTGHIRGTGNFGARVINDLDIFDSADLQALVVGIHRFAVIASILSLADRVGYERDRVDVRSSGLFGES